MSEVRPYLAQTVVRLSHQMQQHIVPHDGYSALRYVAKILFKMGDPYAIYSVPLGDLLHFLEAGILGTADYRLKRQ
jgi:hypothetical protein